jgi:DNA-binding MarR family transcriptional regulator
VWQDTDPYRTSSNEITRQQRSTTLNERQLASFGRVAVAPLCANEVQSSVQEQLVQAFSDFYPAWTKWLRTTLHQSGVTPARVRLLAVLADGPPVTMTTLSKALHVSPRNITTLVDALEAESLVRRVSHPSDRRATIIELTERGLELCNDLWGQHLDGAGRIFATISADEQELLLKTLGRLRDTLRDRGIE